MKSIGSFILLVLLVLTGVWFYRRHQENERKKKELEAEQARQRELERQKLFDFFKTKLVSIKTANSKFAKHLDLKTGYFTNYQLTVWTSQQINLMNEIKGKSYDFIQLSSEEVKSIKTFTDYFNNAINLRNDFNKVFVKEELKTYSTFFDSIEGKKLDSQQRTAIVTDEDNNIIIAGAGSGKTLTIIGKIRYIMDRYKIPAEEILLISFTKKSASDLANRIAAQGINGITAKTFNAFGLEVILIVNDGREPINVFGNDGNELKVLLQAVFNELINDALYLSKVTEYFLDYLKEPKSQFEFENHGKYIQYLKDQHYRPYKIETIGGFQMRRIVKSIEECKIANFLYFNGINYKYSEPYEINVTDYNHIQYCPDFSIYQNGHRIYLEHYGINREGNVPDWFVANGNATANERYNASMQWKEETHLGNQTTLIKTFSYEMFEGTLYEKLTQRLLENGIVLKPKTPEEIWQIINDNAKEEVKDFINLFETFINLIKSNNYSISDISKKNKSLADLFHRKRNEIFIEIIEPIFNRYQNYLRGENQIDFSDMINKAVHHIIKEEYPKRFSYVIIDEFQDISKGRYQLVKGIKTSNPACKLFCVGDDWQSIYRFSGSIIALFKEFENYFGLTVKSKIETTYRFDEPLISMSSNFITKNKNQSDKIIKGEQLKSTHHKIVYSQNQYPPDDTYVLKEILDELIESDNLIETKKIYLLGRYKFDIDRIRNTGNIFHIISGNQDSNIKISYSTPLKKLVVEFLTVHKAKGLESDIVIIINCNAGKHGFPSQISDDPVLNLLLSAADQFANGEERRLFYVAMTRAKEHTYFIADSSAKSKFITELEVESNNNSIRKCPVCIEGDIVRRQGVTNGRQWAFWDCNNKLNYKCSFEKEWEN